MATSIVTKTAKAKMAKARAGVITLPTVAGVAFGDGGVDSSGNPTDVAENATALTNETLRKAYTSKALISDTSYRYTCVLGTTELAGQSISEVGLYDSDGDLINIKHFMAKGKDADMEITFQLDDTF